MSRTSKWHYIAVAKVLAAEYTLARSHSDKSIRDKSCEHIENIVGSMADVFAQDNERFDRDGFYLAVLKRNSLRAPVNNPEFRPGTVSHGTLLAADLIAAFERELERLNPSAFQELRSNYWQFSSDDDYIVALEDALDGEAPEGYCFGAHPGDGSDFGFWAIEGIGAAYSLQDCINWYTNEQGDCGGRVKEHNGVVMCENCLNAGIGTEDGDFDGTLLFDPDK